VKPFWDLLPCRIEQAATPGPVRKLRAQLQRSRLSSRSVRPVAAARRLFVDLAAISHHDAGTGIQRVVRAIALALIEEDPGEWDICFVAANRRRPYHVIAWPDASKIVSPMEMSAKPGDVFLGLDFSLDTVRRYRNQLTQFERAGGRLWFLVCDLLPIERPEWFSTNNVLRYKAWLDTIAGLAEGFLCISDQTAEDLRRVFATRYSLQGGYRTCVVQMGHNIRESLREPAPATCNITMRFDIGSPFSLMVGTLEPRKGHADILAAFSELWRQGADDRLVIVGRMGWAVEGLREALRNHPEHGGKLLWFNDVGDLELERIYHACQGVIIASHAEGFGLPLIEALGHDKPVLARDLPIFRIHERLGVHYFPVDGSATEIGACIREWTEHVQGDRVQVIRPSTSWKLSAQSLLAAID